MGMTMVSRINVGLSVMLALSFAGCDKVPLLAPTNSTVTLTTASVFVPTGGSTEVTAFVAEKSGTPVREQCERSIQHQPGARRSIDAQTGRCAVATFLAGDASGVDVRPLRATALGDSTGTTTILGNVVESPSELQTKQCAQRQPISVPAGGGR
jgi:hypothetical protein